MNQLYLIGPNKTYAIDQTKNAVIGEVDNDELSKIFAVNNSLGLLPPNVRYYTNNGKSAIVCIEKISANKSIKCRYANGRVVSKKNDSFIYLFVKLNRVDKTWLPVGTYVFSKNTRLLSEKDSLSSIKLSNVYDDGKICWGSISIPKYKQSCPMEIANEVTNLFFNTNFQGSRMNTDRTFLFADVIRTLNGKTNE